MSPAGATARTIPGSGRILILRCRGYAVPTEADITEEAIVGWRIDSGDRADPILAGAGGGGEAGAGDLWLLGGPDGWWHGTSAHPSLGDYPSRGDAVRAMLAQARRWSAPRTAERLRDLLAARARRWLGGFGASASAPVPTG